MEQVPIEDNYQEAMDYLINLTKFGFNFGLGRITHLLERIGNPQDKLKVIHIGGTNGKGSTTAMVTSILSHAGYNVGTFTSPHLHDYRERMTINGEMIPKAEIVNLIHYLRPHLDEMVENGIEHPTEFEVSTAMALLYFAREKVDYAVVEVGLGGSIDSTNVVQPFVTVITNVAMDHMDYLGHSITDIATVKAGIIKAGTVVVTAADHPEALNVIVAKAGIENVPIIQVGKDLNWIIHDNTPEGLRFDLSGRYANYPELTLPLAGVHQIRNAACAVAVCESLKEYHEIDIKVDAIYEGLKAVKWPGRMELLSTHPKILLDGAHNVDGAKALADALPLYERNRLILCLGMLGDKEREKVADILIPLADEVIITKPNSPRAGDWGFLAERATFYGKSVKLVPDPGQAALEGVNSLQEGDLLCITGSLYMLAEVRETLIRYLSNS